MAKIEGKKNNIDIDIDNLGKFKEQMEDFMKDQIYILENFTKEELIKLEKLIYKKS